MSQSATEPVTSPGLTTQSSAPIPVGTVLPANTLVPLELLQEISTKKSKPDDYFDLRVLESVLVDDQIAIPAGARAVGQVIDSQRAKGGVLAYPGKFLITIRFVDFDGKRIAMRFYQPSRGTDFASGSADTDMRKLNNALTALTNAVAEGGSRKELLRGRVTYGQAQVGAALGAVIFAGAIAVFRKGDDIILPVGTKLIAQVAKDTSIQPSSFIPSALPVVVTTPGPKP